MDFIIFGLGFLAGVTVMNLVWALCKIGILHVTRTSVPGEGPYLFLELTRDMKTVTSAVWVLMRVKVKDFDTRK